MRKLVISILYLLIIAMAPAISHAVLPQIKVTISDGTTTLTHTNLNTAQTLAFTLMQVSAPPTVTGDVTDDGFKILKCTTRPCTVFFPSGRVASSTTACAASGETFKFQDTNTIGALVRKFDSGGTGGFDAIQLRNFRAIPCGSSGTVRTLTITRETTLDTDNGNSVFRALAGGTYSFSASAVATFRKGTISGSTTTANASTCAVASPPCVKLEIVVRPGLADSNIVNGSLTDTSNTATLTVNSSNISRLSTGVTDTEGPPTTASGIPCGTAGLAGSCKVTLKATLTVRAGITTSSGIVQHDVLSCTSCTAAMANATDEDGGWAALLTGLTGPEGNLADIFVAYTSASQPYKFTPQPPWTNQTRHVNNSSTIPIPFAVEKAVLEPLAAPEKFILLSIGSDNEDSDVPPAEQLLNDAARVSYLPITNLVLWKNVTSIKYSYDVIVDSPFVDVDSSFVDGSNGALRVAITLFDVKTQQTLGKILCFLGSSLENFRGGFDDAAASLSGANLVNDPQERCDATAVGGKAEETLSATQKGQTGNLGVQQIAFVLDRGDPLIDPPVNQKVEFSSAEIKENNDIFTSAGQLFVVNGFEPTCNLELDGRTMRVTNLERNFANETNVKEIPNSQIANTSSCDYRSQQNVAFFEPVNVGANSYQVEMCINGRCFPDAGTLVLLD